MNYLFDTHLIQYHRFEIAYQRMLLSVYFGEGLQTRLLRASGMEGVYHHIRPPNTYFYKVTRSFSSSFFLQI